MAAVLTVGACEKSADQSAPATNTTSEPVQQVVAEQSEPEREAKVTIVKYSDYQCPACAYYHSFEKQLKQDFGDDVKIITKHFPLNIHPYAHVASRSVEAARKQGKYQEMHNLIFAGQSQWSRGNAESIFIGYARSLDLDMEQFQIDMNSADMNRIVISDRRDGLDLGVNSTPTFFINGDQLERNPDSYPLFKEIVEGYLD